MRCGLCRYMLGINAMKAVLVYVGDKGDLSCIGICGGLMRCRLCRYMQGINKM